MKTKLPFQIGKEYENWEFQLEVLEVERIKGYDSYLYLDKVEFIGLEAKYVELIFNYDILYNVIIVFSFNDASELSKTINELDKLQIENLKYRIVGLLLVLSYGKLEVLDLSI